jgi:hypothetical protein
LEKAHSHEQKVETCSRQRRSIEPSKIVKLKFCEKIVLKSESRAAVAMNSVKHKPLPSFTRLKVLTLAVSKPMGLLSSAGRLNAKIKPASQGCAFTTRIHSPPCQQAAAATLNQFFDKVGNLS